MNHFVPRAQQQQQRCHAKTIAVILFAYHVFPISSYLCFKIPLYHHALFLTRKKARLRPVLGETSDRW